MYQLPLLRSEVPTTTKLEESKMLDADQESEDKWVVAQDDSSEGPCPEQQAEELQRLHS